mgnify:CR=1 FL=1
MGFKQILILGIIFLLPLLGSFKGFGYEQIKVLFFIVSISLLGLFFIKKQIKWTTVSKLAGLFILALTLTSLIGINPQNSILGTYPYSQGAILYLYLFLFFLIVRGSNIKLKTYAKVLTGSAAVVGLIAIKDWVLLNLFNQQIPTYAGRVVSTFGQPNFYAGFLLLILPFSYFLFQKPSKKLQILGFSSGLISMIGILVSYSRSAILLSFILLILALIDQLKIKKILIMIFLIFITAAFLSVKFSSGFIWREFFYPTTISNPDLTKESVEKRVYIWPVSWMVILQKPILGYGLENINLVFSNYFQTNKHYLFEENLKISPVLISLKELNIDRTHNYLLDLFLFSGLLGVLGWLGLVGLILKKSYRTILIVPLLTYLIWIQFQNQSVVHLIIFWFLAGVIDKQSEI